jgi:hypothetical protein
MSQPRTRWTCPQCQQSYSVPSTKGLTVCPSCKSAPAPAKSSRRLQIIIAAVVGVAALIAIAVVMLPAKSILPKELAKAITPDPDRAAVEAWLKENLDTPRWEVVKWWPVVDQRPEFEALNGRYQEWKAKNPGPQTVVPFEFERLLLYDQLEQAFPYPHKVVRFKFRTPAPGGTQILHDMFFAINDGKAKPLGRVEFLFPRTYDALDTSLLDLDSMLAK